MFSEAVLLRFTHTPIRYNWNRKSFLGIAFCYPMISQFKHGLFYEIEFT